MAPSVLSDHYPAFPDDVPILPLSRLSYAKLLSNDAVEFEKLFKASQDHGFFLLDLHDTPDGVGVLKNVDTAFKLGKSFFDLDLEEKKKVRLDAHNIGYKPMGLMAFTDGKRDLTEICSVAKDAILDPSVATVPAVFADERPFLGSLTHQLHSIATLILSTLAPKLEIPYETLASLHSPSERSSTILRFLHNPPQSISDSVPSRQASLAGHTDNGSITVLFNTLGGLQILPSDAEDDPANWRWVRPEPGCAIVNIGDSLVQWTGGVLRSAFHRVLYAPGAQASCERYSFGYFLKPNDNASMRRLREGNLIPELSAEEQVLERDVPCYHEWHRQKTKGIMVGKNNVKRGGIPSRQGVLPKEVAVGGADA